MSPKCFINNFGERGIELGEVVDEESERAFNSCWKTELSIYERDPYEVKKQDLLDELKSELNIDGDLDH